MRRSPDIRGWFCVPVAVAGLAVVPAPAAAQEDVPPDTAAAADTVAAPPDTVIGELPGELVGVLADTAPDSAFAVLADPLRPAPDRLAGGAVVWDRERIRRSSALNLGELLAQMAPGTLLVRAGFFAGPIHLVDGPFGPAALDIRIDGRPLVPLIGAQPDLSEIQLAMIDEVRVRREAGGLRVDLTTLRRTDRRAYSRIEAGSGDPDLESLRLVFTNGFGGSFAARAGFELLDSGNPEANLQGFSGGLAWLPGGGTSGVEVQYDQRSFGRAVTEPTTGTRSRLVFGGRIGLSDHLQAAGWIGESARKLDAPEGEAGVDGEGEDVEEPAMAGDRDAVTHGGVELRGVWDRGWAVVVGRLGDGEGLPTREVELEGGAQPTQWLAFELGGRLGAREEFDTREGHLGLAIRLPVAGATLHGQASSGVRGAPYVAVDSVPADSMEFTALAGGLDLRAGPFRLGGRAAHQRVDRQVAFGTGFDGPGVAFPEAKVTSLEATVDVPVLPLSWVADEFDPIRVRGFYRHNEIRSDVTPLYVPTNILRGEVYFEDTVLEGDLGLRLAIGVDRRDPWLAPPTGGVVGEAVAVLSRTSYDFDLGLRIIGALIYWRYDNVAVRIQQDLPGFEFPVRRQVFGVRWSFFD